MALCVVTKQCYYNTMKQLLVHLLTGLFVDTGMPIVIIIAIILAHYGENRRILTDWCDVLNFLIHCTLVPSNNSLGLELVFDGLFPAQKCLASIPNVNYAAISDRVAGNIADYRRRENDSIALSKSSNSIKRAVLDLEAENFGIPLHSILPDSVTNTVQSFLKYNEDGDGPDRYKSMNSLLWNLQFS